MRIKKSLETIVKIIALVLIIMFGISILGVGEINAAVVQQGASVWEIFTNDFGNMNHHEIPVHVIADYFYSIWCSKHGYAVKKKITATEEHYKAWKSGTTGKAYYNEQSPYALYTNTSSISVIKYDAEGNPVRLKDEKGKVIKPTYSALAKDNKGNLILATDENGKKLTEKYTFKDKNGNETTYDLVKYKLQNGDITGWRKEALNSYNQSGKYYYQYETATSGGYGLVPEHRGYGYTDHVQECNSGCHSGSPADYEGDDQELIDALRNELPGMGDTLEKKSIEYQKTDTWTADDKPGAAFALTQRKIYEEPTSIPLGKSETSEPLNPEQLEKGYFTADEKQVAIWDKRLNVNLGNEVGFDTEDEEKWGGVDRNLGEISYQYEQFYKALKAKEQSKKENNEEGKAYADFVTAYPVDNFGNVMGYEGKSENLSEINGSVEYPGENPSSNGKVDYPGQIRGKRKKEDYIKETETEIDGEKYKTYEYQDTKFEIDAKANCYVLRTILYRLFL